VTTEPTRTAVVLAAGRGSRMREASMADTALTPEQRDLAEKGLKMLIPIGGRPFLAWSLDTLAAAGMTDVCIVIGPHTREVRERLENHDAPRLTLRFATQPEPLGSAHAVLAAEQCVGDAPFVLINGDNLYPPADLRRLASAGQPALIGYSSAGLLRGGIPPERIRAFALLDVDDRHCLRRIVEKPSDDEAAALGADAPVSMTCWRFEPTIFDACRNVPPSARGELELPDAVMALIASGERFLVLPSDSAVPDLSRRGDVVRVEQLVSRPGGPFGDTP
jgi:dTDP-glucose pyrophosphorylase